jgi:hypothetical protein
MSYASLIGAAPSEITVLITAEGTGGRMAKCALKCLYVSANITAHEMANIIP